MNSLTIENTVENGRIFRVTMEVPQGYSYLNFELIAKNTYEIINYPTQKVIDLIINRMQEEFGLFRMGNVILLTDESRSYIKLVYGTTIRKESKWQKTQTYSHSECSPDTGDLKAKPENEQN